MKITDITKRINDLLAGETLSYKQLTLHLDAVIDDINTDLASKYPAFSELPEGAVEYTHIPDRYIRSVVCIGAAHYFYITDEEGGTAARTYQELYFTNRYTFVRDWIDKVQHEDERDDSPGAVTFDLHGTEPVPYDTKVFRF